MEWPGQSSSLNPIEIPWQDLKRAVHEQMPSNISEVKQICEQQVKDSPKWCEPIIIPNKMFASSYYLLKVVILVAELYQIFSHLVSNLILKSVVFLLSPEVIYLFIYLLSYCTIIILTLIKKKQIIERGCTFYLPLNCFMIY